MIWLYLVFSSIVQHTNTCWVLESFLLTYHLLMTRPRLENKHSKIQGIPPQLLQVLFNNLSGCSKKWYFLRCHSPLAKFPYKAFLDKCVFFGDWSEYIWYLLWSILLLSQIQSDLCWFHLFIYVLVHYASSMTCLSLKEYSLISYNWFLTEDYVESGLVKTLSDRYDRYEQMKLCFFSHL